MCYIYAIYTIYIAHSHTQCDVRCGDSSKFSKKCREQFSKTKHFERIFQKLTRPRRPWRRQRHFHYLDTLWFIEGGSQGSYTVELSTIRFATYRFFTYQYSTISNLSIKYTKYIYVGYEVGWITHILLKLVTIKYSVTDCCL